MTSIAPDFIDEYYNNSDLNLLKKLTLVIPTYNRSLYFSRCLWYHAHFPFGQIIVADSSQNEIKNINKETVRKIKTKFGRDIIYLEYEPESEKYGGDIYRKWWDALSHSRTEYSQICTDKEFICPSVEVELIRNLEGHSDYIAAHGNECGIHHNQKNTTVAYIRHPTRKIENNPDSLIRLNDSITNTDGFANSLLLAITKTTSLQEIYQTYFDNHNVHDLRYGELYLGYAGYILGKTYHNPRQISKIRDEIKLHNESNNYYDKSAESSTSRYPRYQDYLKEGSADQYYNSIVYSFTVLFKKYTSLGDSEIENYFKNNIRLKSVFNSTNNSPAWDIIWRNYLCHIQPLFYKSPQIIRNIISKYWNGIHNRGNIPPDTNLQNEQLFPEVSSILKIVKNTSHLLEADNNKSNK